MSTVGRANVNISLSRNWEHLQNKYVGTGHPAISKHAWLENQRRDGIAAHVMDKSMLRYIAVSQSKHPARAKFELLNRMIKPTEK